MDTEHELYGVLSVRLPRPELAALQQLAQAEERNVSQVARRLLRLGAEVYGVPQLAPQAEEVHGAP